MDFRNFIIIFIVVFVVFIFFFFQAEDGIRDVAVTGVQTCALPILGDLNVNGKLIITSSGEGFFLQGTDDNRLGINVEIGRASCRERV